MTRVRLVLATAALALAGGLLLFSGGCHTLSVPVDDLLNASTMIQVSARTCTLSTVLWRDFMLGEPPGGSPLYAALCLACLDTMAVPLGVDMDRVWVIKSRGEVWESGVTLGSYQPHPNELWEHAENGPKWGPHIYVDVVVRVRDAELRQYLLRATHQWIARVE
jgi:hypothetical protein